MFLENKNLILLVICLLLFTACASFSNEEITNEDTSVYNMSN